MVTVLDGDQMGVSQVKLDPAVFGLAVSASVHE